MLARLLAAALIYLLSIPFDLGSENCASWFRISVSREGRRGEGTISTRTRVCTCVYVYVCPRAHVCAHLRHVGSLFVPRAERPAVSAVSFYLQPFAPRPLPGVTSPLVVLPLLPSLSPPEAPRIDRQHACKHRCTPCT